MNSTISYDFSNFHHRRVKWSAVSSIYCPLTRYSEANSTATCSPLVIETIFLQYEVETLILSLCRCIQNDCSIQFSYTRP